MKKLLLLFAIVSLFSSCTEKGDLTNDVIMTPSPPTETTPSELKYSGTFVSAPGESVSGSIKIYLQNDHQLVLENVIASGPDLKVYLSKTDKPNDFVNLGSLIKSKTRYDIPQNIDLTSYKFVIIYCQQYSIVFGIAPLTKS